MTASGLVVFDCDGVLVDSEHLVQRVEMAMIAELGWPITVDEMNDQHLGRSWPTIQANIERQIGRPLPSDFRTRAVAEAHELFERELLAVDGVADAIETLRVEGYATCVASSGSHERMRLTLGATGLHGEFAGRIYSSEDVVRGKPEPDLFLHAAAQMGYAPEQCVVVEDSPAGVAAAHAAGMPVIGYAARTPYEMLSGADTVIRSMSDLPSTVALMRERSCR
ncbi:HAD family phosphatase [Nocardioides sp.]|uniref:HAD family hydrolase n=1 Tax=Nocardioides sp. TaxID=35761 RepID=UPI002C973343|nr:HAD family phosphatase [Nocardioides sp.]HSX67400.1 HAD family phosphatase [Nocardioides sp.]